MGGQDDGVRHCPAAVGDIYACVAVVVFVVSGQRAAGCDVGNGEGMGESRDVFIPVLT